MQIHLTPPNPHHAPHILVWPLQLLSEVQLDQTASDEARQGLTGMPGSWEAPFPDQ